MVDDPGRDDVGVGGVAASAEELARVVAPPETGAVALQDNKSGTGHHNFTLKTNKTACRYIGNPADLLDLHAAASTPPPLATQGQGSLAGRGLHLYSVSIEYYLVTLSNTTVRTI